MAHKSGALPIQMIRRFMDAGFITGIDQEELNPDSVNLPVSKGYRIDSVFKPNAGESIESIMPLVNAREIDFSQTLERGVPHLFKLACEIELPDDVHAYANPRSSIGRTNVFSRLIADGVEGYDYLPKGWSGTPWVLVRADSFPVLTYPGIAFSQLRLFKGRGFIDELQMDLEIKKHGLLFDPRGKRLTKKALRRHNESLICSLYVGPNMGYECRGTIQELDLSRNGHKARDFFEPISAREDGTFILRKGVFYILATYERVLVPPHLAGDLSAIDPRIGEFRTHAAGYINPGWGCGVDGKGTGDVIVLEVTPLEDMLVRPGQAIVSLRYDQMWETPEVVYAGANASSYVGQNRATLAKFFNPIKKKRK